MIYARLSKLLEPCICALRGVCVYAHVRSQHVPIPSANLSAKYKYHNAMIQSHHLFDVPRNMATYSLYSKSHQFTHHIEIVFTLPFPMPQIFPLVQISNLSAMTQELKLTDIPPSPRIGDGSRLILEEQMLSTVTAWQ